MPRLKSVYVLRCPETNDIRYVGVTAEGGKRLARHVREARANKTHRHRWISKLVKAGKLPVFEIVESDAVDWSEAEKRWVAKFRADGCDLVNGNDGGKCMHQTRAPSGQWPSYRRAMRVLGQNSMFLKRWKPESPVIKKVEAAQARLRAAAKAAKERGEMANLDARLRGVVGDGF